MLYTLNIHINYISIKLEQLKNKLKISYAWLKLKKKKFSAYRIPLFPTTLSPGQSGSLIAISTHMHPCSPRLRTAWPCFEK